MQQGNAQLKDSEFELIEDIASFAHDPLGYVLYAFPWGSGELIEKYPDKWQVDLLKAVGDGLMTVNQAVQVAIASGHDIGKAQPKSLMFYTPSGLRRWGDLKVGDEVFGSDGRPTKIIAIHERGIKEVYQISFDDDSSTLACADHVWKVRGRAQRRRDRAGGRSNKWINKTTKEIIEAGVYRKNGKVTTRQWEIPNCEAVEFFPKEIPVDPYLLGLWLGDGGRKTSRITNIEPDINNQLEKREIRFSIGSKKGTDAKSLFIYGLKAKLKTLGILDCYSYEKYIPELYKQNSSFVRAELLRGLLDTDGESNKYGSVLFSSTSEKLADDVVWLARSLGGRARLSPTVKRPTYNGKNGKKLNGRICYRVVLSMPHDFKFFYVKRKQERVGNFRDRYLHRWITSIEPITKEACMCITVAASDGLYLTNDFIVTHNSALVAWLVLWGISTFEDTRGIVTANTDTQLRTKTWPEISKWHRLSINKHWFHVTATAIYSTNKDHEKTWRIDIIPWSETNTEAFAGLHNEGKRVLLIFDESSAIIDKIWEVAEGAMFDSNTEVIWAVFGNPTRNTGRFKECFGRFKHRWITRQIDSRDCKIPNKQKIQELIDDYGIDSDFVKVRVRGMFPSMSVMQFISTEDVDKAFGRSIRPDQYQFAPKILTLDNAWQGDDEGVIGLRQGLAFKILKTFAKNDNDLQVATMLAAYEDQEGADAVFIDAGYGTGVVSAGKSWKRDWKLVWFAEKSNDDGYLNKRAEMWGKMRDWLKDGGCIPEDNTLHDDLIGPEVVGRTDGKVQLESKQDMKKRGLKSPGRGDALALSFAYPVQSKHRPRGRKQEQQAEEWSPMDNL